MSTAEHHNRRYDKSSSIVARKIAGELILVPIRKTVGDIDSIYALNDVGRRIWELLDGEKSVAEIRDTIVAEFETTHEEAEADLLEFLQGLEQVGAVREV